MSDKIEEIEKLKRHLALVSEQVRQLSEERDFAWAEIEKLRAENEQLSAVDAILQQYFPQTHEGILAEIALMRLEGKP